MFNVLNRFIARLDGDAPPSSKEDLHGAFGFQVLRNTNAQLAIEPWYDFVVGINGRVLDDSDPLLFAQEVRNCAGSSVALGLWNAKGQRTRTMHIALPADTVTLGLALQWTPLAAVSTIWHVLDVQPRSPADAAGLLPYSDYVVGTPEGVLHGEGGLGELVEDHIGRPLRLWVYNNEYDVTRELTIQPGRDWGGEGALGCVLGYGALHRLPAPLNEPVSAPGETLFDGAPPAGDPSVLPSTGPSTADPAQDSTNTHLIVPAQLVPAPAATPRAKKKDRHHHAPAAGLSMDDYFKEEEAKSQALDNVPSRKATPLAPPPKGPPHAATPQSETVEKKTAGAPITPEAAQTASQGH